MSLSTEGEDEDKDAQMDDDHSPVKENVDTLVHMLDINLLEMKFCELMQFNFHIKASTYARYYFGLNGLQSTSLKGVILENQLRGSSVLCTSLCK